MRSQCSWVVGAWVAVASVGCVTTEYRDQPYEPRVDYGACLEDVEPVEGTHVWFIAFRRPHQGAEYSREVTIALEGTYPSEYVAEWHHRALRFNYWEEQSDLPHFADCVNDAEKLEYTFTHHNFSDSMTASGEHEYQFDVGSLLHNGDFVLTLDGGEPLTFEMTRIDQVYPVNTGRESYPF